MNKEILVTFVLAPFPSSRVREVHLRNRRRHKRLPLSNPRQLAINKPMSPPAKK